jgi:hypothetical protein
MAFFINNSQHTIDCSFIEHSFYRSSIYLKSMFIMGFCFYMVSAFYVIKRYITSSWSIELDWNNTNCILHGAISISGIACMTTKVLNESSIHFIWTLALIVFFIVECIEISRFFKRIKKDGVKKGILIYDVTQWSRIFTSLCSIPLLQSSISMDLC